MLLMPATRRTKDSVRQMRNIVTLALIALPGCYFPPINYSGSYQPYSTPNYTQTYTPQRTNLTVPYQPAPRYTCNSFYARGQYCQTCNGNTVCQGRGY